MDEASKAAGAEEETCEMSFDLLSGDLFDSSTLVRVYWGRGADLRNVILGLILMFFLCMVTMF